METTSNRALKGLQEISDSRGHNLDSISASVEAVLKTPNTVYFQDLAYFSLLINSPSGAGIGTLLKVINSALIRII